MQQHHAIIRQFYTLLRAAFGPQHWWPIQKSDAAPQHRAVEIISGAILTQNTSWKNVEKAIARMHESDLMSWIALRDVPESHLATVLKPAGTFRVKSRRIKSFVDHLWHHHKGRLDTMFDASLDACRNELLSINGIGDETADVILVYVALRPSFVIDAYTRRILRRHFIIEPNEPYTQIQTRFHMALPDDATLFNEYHALLVELAKQHCRVRAQCDGCPISHHDHDESL